MKKYFLITAGFIFLFLGFTGIFVPVLPTTPFLLLASFCFLKSSDRLYQWVINHRLFGKYIENYIKYRAVSLKAKIYSISFLWLTIAVTVIFFTQIPWLRIILLLIATAVTVYLLMLKTLKNEQISKNRELILESSKSKKKLDNS